MTKRRRQPARREPPLGAQRSRRLHDCVKEVSMELAEVLGCVSLDLWEPRAREEGEAELRQAISYATDSPDRQQVLFENVLETVYTSANVALDYMKSLPLLLVSDSILAVRPMARATLEAFARLDWHCESDLSPEERVLRAFVELRKTFGKIDGRWQGLQAPDDEPAKRREARDLMTKQSALLRSSMNEEIKRIAELVMQNHGKRRRDESKRLKGPTMAVNEVLERVHGGPTTVATYSVLSDSAHADAWALALRLIHRSNSRRTYQFSHTPTLADHLMPIVDVVLLMFNTLLRMHIYWRIDAPYDDINSICGLLNRHITEHGADLVWDS